MTRLSSQPPLPLAAAMVRRAQVDLQVPDIRIDARLAEGQGSTGAPAQGENGEPPPVTASAKKGALPPPCAARLPRDISVRPEEAMA